MPQVVLVTHPISDDFQINLSVSKTFRSWVILLFQNKKLSVSIEIHPWHQLLYLSPYRGSSCTHPALNDRVKIRANHVPRSLISIESFSFSLHRRSGYLVKLSSGHAVKKRSFTPPDIFLEPMLKRQAFKCIIPDYKCAPCRLRSPVSW